MALVVQKFQFHTGTINGKAKAQKTEDFLRFQFHTGTINGSYDSTQEKELI